MAGFSNEDLYRMLDKGPWILAFSTKSLKKLTNDLKNDIGFNNSAVRHILSHCPYLVAQYARFPGRDVYASAAALLDSGYESSRLIQDCIRFPSILASPPDRIRGWKVFKLYKLLIITF